MDPLSSTIKKKKKSLLTNQNTADDFFTGYQMPTPPFHPSVAPATATALQNGADATILDKARKSVGVQDFVGLCEKFVELATQGHAGIYPSAIADWQANQDKATQNPKAGDKVFFSANTGNQGYGHVGVYTGNGNFISATNTGVKELPLANWVKSTGQKILGFVPNG